jgi:hypothetical protein
VDLSPLQYVQILHEDAAGLGVVYGRYGTNHGGQFDVCLPPGQCLGVADPDTGLLYGFSEIRTNRSLGR